ncbi:CubicO group peptidase, beta-lactamase class C family [Yoonia tamlensis]|uniref:CubicO group peptidase, beta-lactamase class C family n=1 Tax=Yoonia tamlensis TaxID=390270 RepID=A0A1I6GU89_9RHOB|nr:serine hydrolase domain-containing protein [Yoonia tamlensis]SFR45730.1 CubicO group peptidase, beta-lactamase class C family [Yoonia tamlensis]
MNSNRNSPLGRAFEQQFSQSNLVSGGFGFQCGGGAPEIYVGGTKSRTDLTPVPVDAAWHIGSITKTFTAALVLMLAQDGQIDIDAPVATYFDAENMHSDWRALTLAQVLGHRAGIQPNPNRADMLALYAGKQDRHQLLSAQWRAPLPGKPGAFQYSNIGYIFAAYVIETVTGQSWEDLLRARIINPLGLSSFGIGPPAGLRGHRSALGLFKRPVAPQAPRADNPPVFTPAGRMHLSIADMLTWGRFLLSAEQGDNAQLARAHMQRMTDTLGGDYGMGLMRFGIPGTGQMAWGHDGSNRLWYGLLAIVPAQNAVGFVISGEGRMRKVAKLGIALMAQALNAKA